MANLIAQRDDCAERINAGEGTKWTRKRLRQLDAELKDHRNEVASFDGASLMPAFPWQLDLTKLVEDAVYVDGTGKDKTTCLRGKTIDRTATDLQLKLQELGHRVDVRTLRKFLREKEVNLADEQGRRRDLGK